MSKIFATVCLGLVALQGASALEIAQTASIRMASLERVATTAQVGTCDVNDVDRCMLKHNVIRAGSTPCSNFEEDMEKMVQCIVNVGCKEQLDATISAGDICRVEDAARNTVCDLCDEARAFAQKNLTVGQEPGFAAWEQCDVPGFAKCLEDSVPTVDSSMSQSEACGLLEKTFKIPEECASKKSCPVDEIRASIGRPICEVVNTAEVKEACGLTCGVNSLANPFQAGVVLVASAAMCNLMA